MAYVPDGQEQEGDVAVTKMHCSTCGKTTTWYGTYTRKNLIGRETVRDSWKCGGSGRRY